MVKFRNESEVFRAVQRAVRQALTAQLPVAKIEEVAAPYAPEKSSQMQLPDLPREDAGAPPEVPSLLATLPALRVVGPVAIDQYRR